MSDMTYAEAAHDAMIARLARDQAAWKARIIGSAVEMGIVIDAATPEKRLEIHRMIALIADHGLELENPHQAKVLSEQVKELVIDFGKLIETAIEDYIEGGSNEPR